MTYYGDVSDQVFGTTQRRKNRKILHKIIDSLKQMDLNTGSDDKEIYKFRIMRDSAYALKEELDKEKTALEREESHLLSRGKKEKKLVKV